jgi:hypothetical protein
LERSAEIFWKDDGSLAIINDHTGSDTSKVRLVLVRPRLAESGSIEKLIDGRRRREFHTSKMLHQYIVAQGWTTSGHLLVSIYADGMPPDKTEGRAIGFCRGYVVNTKQLTVIEELSQDDLKGRFRLRPCD